MVRRLPRAAPDSPARGTAAEGRARRSAEAVSGLQKQMPGFSIDHALAFYRMWNFRQAYLDRMAEGLRRAGLPKADPFAAQPDLQR